MFQGRAAELEGADTRLTLLGHLVASERIGCLLLELRERSVRGLFGARSGPVPLIRAVARIRIHTPHWFAAATLLIRKVLENRS